LIAVIVTESHDTSIAGVPLPMFKSWQAKPKSESAVIWVTNVIVFVVVVDPARPVKLPPAVPAPRVE
jgi:hypothetical protein